MWYESIEAQRRFVQSLCEWWMPGCRWADRLYEPPPFGISSIRSGERSIPVVESVVDHTPFCELRHFARVEGATAGQLGQADASAASIFCLRSTRGTPCGDAARNDRNAPAKRRRLRHRLDRCAGCTTHCGTVRAKRLHTGTRTFSTQNRQRSPARGSRLSGNRARPRRVGPACERGNSRAAKPHPHGRPDRHPVTSDRDRPVGASTQYRLVSQRGNRNRCTALSW
jgi:hypothetical protein